MSAAAEEARALAARWRSDAAYWRAKLDDRENSTPEDRQGWSEAGRMLAICADDLDAAAARWAPRPVGRPRGGLIDRVADLSHLSDEAIAEELGISRGNVREYRRRARSRQTGAT